MLLTSHPHKSLIKLTLNNLYRLPHIDFIYIYPYYFRQTSFSIITYIHHNKVYIQLQLSKIIRHSQNFTQHWEKSTQFRFGVGKTQRLMYTTEITVAFT